VCGNLFQPWIHHIALLTVNHDADVTICNDGGDDPHQFAALVGRINILEYLLQKRHFTLKKAQTILLSMTIIMTLNFPAQMLHTI